MWPGVGFTRPKNELHRERTESKGQTNFQNRWKVETYFTWMFEYSASGCVQCHPKSSNQQLLLNNVVLTGHLLPTEENSHKVPNIEARCALSVVTSVGQRLVLQTRCSRGHDWHYCPAGLATRAHGDTKVLIIVQIPHFDTSPGAAPGFTSHHSRRECNKSASGKWSKVEPNQKPYLQNLTECKHRKLKV